MPIQLIDLAETAAIPIANFSSSGAAAIALAHGAGEAHAYLIHLAPGGEIGPHPAGFDQLFVPARGSGWVAGSDGVRHAVTPQLGAFIPKGELHAKGSEAGMTAVMIQASEFTLAPHHEG